MSMPWPALFLLLVGAFLCAAALKKYDSQNDITCSQGLKQCTVINENFLVPRPDFGPVGVLSFDVKPALCCKAAHTCQVCLRIQIRLQILADEDGVSGETLEDSEDEDRAAITLCYVSVPNLRSCKRIEFIVKSEARENQEVMVVVYEGVFLGSSVNVTVNRTSQVVQLPKHDSVCPSPDVEECRTPRIFPEIDGYRGVVELKADHEEPLLMCMKRKRMALCWLSSRTIPLHAVTHCTCFQAWRKNTKYEKSSRSEICPFEDHKEFRSNALKNVSLSVGHSKTNEGRPALSWNVSAPCRLEAEVWPCQMAVSLGGGCMEVPGFRRNISTGWEENISMVWTSGAFLDVRTTNNLLPCVMFKVDGETFGPVCEQIRRGRWICLVFVMLLLFLLLTVGGSVFSSRFKEWLSNSKPTHQTQGLRGEVLLVHPSSSDPSLSDTVSQLATWLSELGFSVSLDLWNQAAVNAVGPIPWLHSRLQHVQNHGGKTLLLLSHNAVLQARSCCDSWNRVLNGEDDSVSTTSWPWSSDVFSSALSSLFSTRLQGTAAEHFALVTLESESLDMPELFQGLRLYQLPSESQRLLVNLHTGHPGSIGAQLKRFLWTWRASVRLEKRLRNCEKEQRSRTVSTLTQVETLSMEREVEEETLPLHT